MSNRTSFADIVKHFKLHDEYSEIPKLAVDYLKVISKNVFSDIGYQWDNIRNAEAIPEFMTRYEIVNLLEEQVEFLADNHTFKKMYWEHLKGKRFRNPKGLLLFGTCGTGKTLAARIIAKRFKATFIDTYRIAFEYLKKDGNDWLADFLDKHCKSLLVIDDLGAEGEIRKFGNESPIGAIIATRARHWEMFGTPTIYTTNFTTAEKLTKLYGEDQRLQDRLDAYQVHVEFTGASLRK